MRAVRPSFALIAVVATLVGGVGVGASTGQAGPEAQAARTSPVGPTPKATAAPKVTPVPTPSPVPTPTPEPIPKEPICTTGAASHGGKPAKIRARVLRLDGVVEIRGSRTLLEVEACAGRNAYPTQEFTLLKATKTSRSVAAMSTRPVRAADGTISYVFADVARPRSEAAFRRMIPRPKVTLRLPGVKGVVFADPGTPLDLLATHRNGKPVPQQLRQKIAKAYLLTGGAFPAK